MSQERWMPAPPASGPDRAWAVAALNAIRHSLNAAALDDRDEKDEDAQRWAMRILGSLQAVTADLLWLRNHLARVANDAGVSNREIGDVMGVSHPTAARMVRLAREQTPPPFPLLWHLNLNDDDQPGAESLVRQLTDAGVAEEVAQQVRDALAARPERD